MKTHIIDESNIKTWRTEIPNTVIRGKKSKGLSVHSKWLYVYLKSVAGETGKCWQSTKTLREGSGLSRGQVSKSKKELENIGLITIKKGSVKRGESDVITVKDIWASNILEFSENQDKETSSDPVHQVNTPRSPHEHPPSPGEHPVHQVNLRKNPIKKNPIKKSVETLSESQRSATEVAEYLLESILHYDPDHRYGKNRPSIKGWITEIDRAIRLDGRTQDQLVFLIDYIFRLKGKNSAFWAANIESGTKLRSQFDKIKNQIKAERNGKQSIQQRIAATDNFLDRYRKQRDSGQGHAAP